MKDTAIKIIAVGIIAIAIYFGLSSIEIKSEKHYYEQFTKPFYTIIYDKLKVINWGNGNTQKIVLDSDYVIKFKNYTEGQIMKLFVCQDEIGSHRIYFDIESKIYVKQFSEDEFTAWKIIDVENLEITSRENKCEALKFVVLPENIPNGYLIEW